MKQWLLIILAMGALIIGYRQPIMEKFLGWFVAHDAIRVTAPPANKALIPYVVRGRGELQAVEVVDVVSPVAGQLSKVQLKVGDKVAKGQTLATVRSRELLQRDGEGCSGPRSGHSGSPAKGKSACRGGEGIGQERMSCTAEI